MRTEPHRLVCYDVRCSSSVYRKYTDGKESHKNQVKYENLKIFFHGPKKKGVPGNPFILATEFFSFKAYGLTHKENGNRELCEFLSAWFDEDIDPVGLYDMTFEEIKAQLIDKSAEIDFTVIPNDRGGKKTVINAIRPTDHNIWRIPNIKTPAYLLKGCTGKKGGSFPLKKASLKIVEEQC